MNVPPGAAPADRAGPAAAQDRRRHFERFADQECTEDPLYVSLCRLLAQRPHAIAWLDRAAPMQRRPNLLLAALHERVLAGQAPQLAAYFPSAGGTRSPDDGLPAALDQVLDDQSQALQSTLCARTTQTNEIGRCAVLGPALAAIASACGSRPLALLDLGCSAGLNLGVDHCTVDFGGYWLGAPPSAQSPRIHCHLVGGVRPPLNVPARIVDRLGIDPEPVDVHDDDALRWLRACLWPHDTSRQQRFDQAVAILRRAGWPVRRTTHCLAAIEPWLDALPDGVQPVVFNSWVLAYFEPEPLQRHIAAMRTLVQRRGVAWLSAEGPGLLLGQANAPPPGDECVSATELANATLWWLTLPGTGGAPTAELLARSHPHGRWLAWAR